MPSPTHNSDDLLGALESAGILGVDRATLQRWVQSGVISPAGKLPGRTGPYVFRRADVEELARRRGEVAEAERALEAARARVEAARITVAQKKAAIA